MGYSLRIFNPYFGQSYVNEIDEMKCITRHDKSLLFPLVVYSDTAEVGGRYYAPERREFEIDGRLYDCTKGIIEVSSQWPNDIDATLTHEWRHHWQRHNIGKFPNWPWIPSVDYEQAVRRYFTAWHEFDALRFEYTHARTDTNDYWWGLITSRGM